MNSRSIFLLKAALTHVTNHCSGMFFIIGMEQTQGNVISLCLMCDFAAMFGLVFSLLPMLL
jgi:hypothetical protein